MCKGACHKVKFKKFKGEKCVGFSFLCYFMKIQYFKLNFIYWNFRLPSHLSHKSLSLISLSSNEMHHTFIPFIYSAHGSYPMEGVILSRTLLILWVFIHLPNDVSFSWYHPSCWSINIHLLCLWFHSTKLIHTKSQHSLINSGFKQWVQISDRSIQQGLVNGSSLSVCLTSWESKVLSSNVFFFGGESSQGSQMLFKKWQNCDFHGFFTIFRNKNVKLATYRYSHFLSHHL